MPLRPAAAIPALMFLVALAAAAQDHVETHTIDAGGGTSTGAGWAVSGTLGQPDAVPVSSCTADGGADCSLANWDVTGGFWPGLSALPTTPSPACGATPDCLFRDGFED